MTKEEIIKMAKQAGFVEYELDDGTTDSFDKHNRTNALHIAAYLLRHSQKNAAG